MDPQVVLQEAMQLGEDGEWDEMARLLAGAVKDEAEPDPYLLCWLGVAERELGNETAAYEAFRRCVAADPTDANLLAMAGSGLASYADPDAERVLRTAALTAPDLAFTRLSYGAYLAREGLYPEAIEQLEAAVALEPDDPSAYSELGIAHSLAGDHVRAAAAMERTLELAPDDSWTRVLLGLTYTELEDFEQAAETLVLAAEERPDDGEAQVLAALAAGIVGWDAAALDVLARAEYASEQVDADLITEVEEALDAGREETKELLVDGLAPVALHDRLAQPL